jgi:hypothetical protein
MLAELRENYFLGEAIPLGLDFTCPDVFQSGFLIKVVGLQLQLISAKEAS